jgi:hypothetical protein
VVAARGSATTTSDDGYLADVVTTKLAQNCNTIVGRRAQLTGHGVEAPTAEAKFFAFVLTVPTHLHTRRGLGMGGLRNPIPEIVQVANVYAKVAALRKKSKINQGVVETIQQVHSCMHTCIHAYIHTYIHTCTRAYTHTCVYAYIHTYIHTYAHTYIHTYMFTRTYAYMYE